jgi:hypothetical protein
MSVLSAAIGPSNAAASSAMAWSIAALNSSRVGLTPEVAIAAANCGSL